jgi:serine/threonine-protein kinase
LDQIVMKALAKNRDQRYSTASEFLADLQAFKHGGRISAPPVAAGAETDATQVIPPAPLPVAAAASYPPSLPPAGASFQNAGILPPGEAVEEDEAAAAARRRRRITIWVIVGVVVAALVVAGILLLTRKDEPAPTPTGSPGAAMVQVPEVPTSREVADAVKALEGAKLKAEEGKGENSDTVPKGQVIRFDPASGRPVEEGSTVKYILSLGSDTVIVPPTEGKSQAEATDILTTAGLKVVGTKTVNSAKVPVDMVTGTEPPVDTTVPYGMDVYLLISNGKTTVPDCAGKTQTECSNALATAGLNVGQVTSEESDQPVDTVIRTDPAQGTDVNQGNPVVIVVAKAAETVTLRDLAGLSASEARSWLDGAGLTIQEVRETSTKAAEGVVLRTEPAAGGAVPKGSTVKLVVSSGPGPQTPTPDPT